jgi:hypothetical protein
MVALFLPCDLLLELLHALDEGVDAVAHGGIGDAVDPGDILQAAAGFDQMDDKLLLLGVETREDAEAEIAFDRGAAIGTPQPRDAEGMVATGARDGESFMRHAVIVARE